MTAIVDGPASIEPGQSRPDHHSSALPIPEPPIGDQQLRAQDNDRVYQAGGNQLIIDYGSPAPAPVSVINTLLRDTAAFTGRDRELKMLIEAVEHAARSDEVIPVYAIDGMAGVGKTALVIHAARLLARYFPDGQYYVDLHAHTADRGPAEPADVIAGLLAADGVPQGEIASGRDERAAQWRARMAGKRVLLTMDNAANRSQVEWLLPGTAGCLVLIASRRRLAGLRARHAAEIISLGTLPPDQAAGLFVQMARRNVVPAETRAVADIVQLCGCLPLAIVLLAAKLGPEPQWRIADLVDELAATQDRLQHMRAEDLAVRSAFDLSYRDLPPVRCRFFRRLGLHPGVEFDAYATAALDGISVVEAREHLESLYDDHLLDQTVRGRFRMHDLVREYARSLVAHDLRTECDQAINRLLDYYQSVADRCGGYLATRPRSTGPIGAPRAIPTLTTADQAMEWMDVERTNLLACVAYARSNVLEHRLIGLAAALAAYLSRTGPWDQAIALHRDAAAAAERYGNPAAQANALFELSVLLRQTGDYQAADTGLQKALAVFVELGDRLRQADVLEEMASVCRPTGDFRRAVEVLNRALAIYDELHDHRGQAGTLNSLAVVHWLTDALPEAARLLDRALAIYDGLGDRSGRADTLFSIGVVRRMSSDYPGAVEALGEALAGYRELGDRRGEANARHNLSLTCRLTGNYREAEQGLVESIAIYAELGDRLGEANSRKHLGVVHRLMGDYPEATRGLNEALALYDSLGDQFGRAGVLASLGVVRRMVGDLEAAGAALRESLAVYTGLDNRLGQAEALNAMGALLLQTDDPSQALTCHERALAAAVDAGSSLEEARAFQGVGRCAMRRHEEETAKVYLRQALVIYRRIGVPEALSVSEELSTLESHPGADDLPATAVTWTAVQSRAV